MVHGFVHQSGGDLRIDHWEIAVLHRDPVLADISMHDPTILWIVVDVVGLGLELGGSRALLRFGGPTIPADMAVFALNVIDRGSLGFALLGVVAAVAR